MTSLPATPDPSISTTATHSSAIIWNLKATTIDTVYHQVGWTVHVGEAVVVFRVLNLVFNC